jgi:3-oxoacyl-[acyl-carrier protein] reductase
MKKVLVSGTSSGLGMHIARDLAKDHRVIGFARRECQDEDLLLSPNFTHLSNVDVQSDMEKIYPLLAPTDILINNVGVAQNSLLATTTESEILRIISINLTSAILITREYVRQRLASRKSGVVLNVSSIIASNGYAGLSVYSASKAGMEGFNRSLAREMGGKGFRFNSLSPGYFESDLSASLSENQKAQIIRRTPLGRLARYDDLIPAVRFLISDNSQFITGQNLIVDGGITV